ncbi:hypothetical protein NKI12_26770 [Mesorhizobium australicum]|uniref:Uncharacterized protein n=1 Tax=Mesorhizobium australicum TaxID=536018 RepID=A0ACC6T696_9HYPH
MSDIPSPTQLGTIYNAKEAASRLQMTPRGVITLGKRYGCCSMDGRNALFSEQDLLDIWQIMRAPATATKPVSVRSIAFYSSNASYRDLLRTVQREGDEKRRQRKERETAERERRLDIKREASRAKLDAKIAKRGAALEAKWALRAAADAEPLDVNNRDPAYWTEERKLRLRDERIARLSRDAK